MYALFWVNYYKNDAYPRKKHFLLRSFLFNQLVISSSVIVLGHILFAVLATYLLTSDSASSNFLLISVWFYFFEAAHEGLVHTHDRSIVVEFTAIICRGENGNEFSTGKELVAVFLDLMPSSYQIYVELFDEVLDDILVEDVADSSFTLLILLVLIFFRVSPK